MMLFCSAVIIVLLPFAGWLKILLLALLLGYGFFLMLKFALLRTAFSVTALEKMDAKRWQLQMRAGKFDAILRGDSTVTTLVSVLRFDVSGQKFPLVAIVFRDSLPADDYRRLVATIRMG